MNRLAVLASGNGTNLQAVLDACVDGRLPAAQVVAVVVNHRDAYALERAQRSNIPTLYHPFYPYRQDGRSRSLYDADLAALLEPYKPDLIILAGWMHILSMAFLKYYPGRVLNIHPALPGTFPGMHAIERAYEAFQRGEIDHTGVMVHLAPDEGVDVGPLVLQREVPIYPADSLEDLEARMHETEHELYIEAIAKVLAQLVPNN
ncbi:MAG: phosphoribosylglycinamide formyltransferase [Chloroflexi bacterium]|nr:phosphoribosylglycinamide formyltransferase [Chloroflexota bacterium]